MVGAQRLASLRAQGIDTVINLLPDTSAQAVADEAAIVTGQRMAYIHIPVDFAAPTVDDFDQFTEAMAAVDGQIVHIHCAANYRVSVFYGLWAVAQGMWSSAQARDLIDSLWRPQDHAGWPAFITAVGQHRHAGPLGDPKETIP